MFYLFFQVRTEMAGGRKGAGVDAVGVRIASWVCVAVSLPPSPSIFWEYFLLWFIDGSISSDDNGNDRDFFFFFL